MTVCNFQKIYFIYIVKIIVNKLFIIFFLNICRIYRDVTSLILHIDKFYLSSFCFLFFQISLAESLLILLNSSRICFLVLLIFLFAHFLFHLISILSFHLFVLSWLFFFQFLKMETYDFRPLF